jgi:uncharacterized protein (DUF433 family)/DNA-binding transcriptional MerR regulator
MTPFGLGLYALTDAARLIRTEPRSIRRWLYGHTYTTGHGEHRMRRTSPALWAPQYNRDELGEAVIGFQDLLELRVIRQFVDHGVPLAVVRRCLNTAHEVFGAAYPLTRRRFVTDGATLFAESLEAEARASEQDGDLLNLSNRQYTFKTIIKDSLYTGIEYEDGQARRWYPEQRSKVVVMDPALQFGHPMIEESGVPTASLYACYLAENRQKAVVARVFEVPIKQVEAAVRFEEKLRQVA